MWKVNINRGTKAYILYSVFKDLTCSTDNPHYKCSTTHRKVISYQDNNPQLPLLFLFSRDDYVYVLQPCCNYPVREKKKYILIH